jgi:transposase-like protein
MRAQAVKWYVDGLSLRRIGRHLGVDHVTVMHWVKAHTDRLLPAAMPQEQPLHVVEMDELYTFVAKKRSGSTS